MVAIQSVDAEQNVYACANPGGKGMYLGALWVGEPMTGMDQGTLLAMQSLLAGNFPTGAILQFGLLSAPDIEDSVMSYRVRKFDAPHPLLKELSERHAELIGGGTRSPVVRASGVLLSRKRLTISL
jgi:hypothetical protein